MITPETAIVFSIPIDIFFNFVSSDSKFCNLLPMINRTVLGHSESYDLVVGGSVSAWASDIPESVLIQRAPEQHQRAPEHRQVKTQTP